MPIWEYAGNRIEVDEEGYLVRFEDWSEEVACGLAEKEGISASCPLTEERMAILRFMRDYFKKFDAFPMIPKVCRNRPARKLHLRPVHGPPPGLEDRRPSETNHRGFCLYQTSDLRV